MAAAMGVGRFVYTPILPAMVAALDLSKAEAGLIASANFIGYLLGALLAASPVIRGSKRGWLVGGLAVSALTTGAMGYVGDLPAFLALRFAGGIASAFVLVFASTLVLDRLAAAGRSSLSSVHFAGVGIGIAVSAAIVSASTTAGTDWRGLWIDSAVAALAALFIAAVLIPGGAEPQARAEPARPGGRGLGALILAYGLFGFGYIITATFIVDLVRGTPNLAPLEPYIWIAVGLAAVPSVAFWNRAAVRIGLPVAFAIACIVEAFGVALSVLWDAPAAVLIGAVLLGGTMMGITALGLLGARRLGARDPRRWLALATAAFGLGQIVGPSFAGYAHDVTGSFLLPSLVAAAALVLAAALQGFVRVPVG
ncbi:MAG: YbfB/YjiJ family MFS transporter [Dongiaceae bacterium]